MTHPTQSRDALPVRSATERWLPAVAALGAVVLGLLLTFLVWREVREQSDLGAAARFTGTIQDVRTRLDQRLDAYAQILRGATGLVLTRASIDRATWAAYHASLEIPKRFPGVQTFLWVPAVPPGGAAAFEREQRRRGHPDFRIWTRGDAKPVTTIAFVEPFVRENTKALGFDMYSEPVRREAMERLSAALDEAQQARAMAGCACGPGQAQLDAARKIFQNCANLQEYCDRRNGEMKGAARFEACDGLLYISYPRCYCSMVKNSPTPVPRTWCLCSCEYTRRACSHAFGREVEVRLLKSTIAGDEECLFEVKAW